jgi:hypothetical protein
MPWSSECQVVPAPPNETEGALEGVYFHSDNHMLGLQCDWHHDMNEAKGVKTTIVFAPRPTIRISLA